MSQRAETRGCGELQDRLEALLDGDLGPREAELLRRHVDTCPLCSAELQRAQELRRQLRSMPTFHVPTRVAQAVAAAAGMSEGGTQSPWRFRALRWMPLTATVAAAVLLTVLAGPSGRRATPVAREAAAARQAAAEAKLALHLLADVTLEAQRKARARVFDDAVVPTAQRVSSSLWWLREAGAARATPHEPAEAVTAEGSLRCDD